MSCCINGRACRILIETKNETICVPSTDVAAHLAHGDKLGTCGINANCKPVAYRAAEEVTESGDPSLSAIVHARVEFRAATADRTTVSVYNTQGVLVANLLIERRTFHLKP